jgi:hypothetical protein
MGWLILAAVALALFAGLCASADAALLRVSRAGAKELATSGNQAPAPLQAVLAEVPKYIAVLLLARVIAEIAATLLVAAELLHWAAQPWPGVRDEHRRHGRRRDAADRTADGADSCRAARDRARHWPRRQTAGRAVG